LLNDNLLNFSLRYVKYQMFWMVINNDIVVHINIFIKIIEMCEIFDVYNKQHII